MNRTKYILRGALLLLIALIVINLYRKTDDNIARIAKFKIETLNKINSDSLDTEQKFDLLVNETTKFNEQFIGDSPDVKDGLRYLIGIVGLLIVDLSLVFLSGKEEGRVNKKQNGLSGGSATATSCIRHALIRRDFCLFLLSATP